MRRPTRGRAGVRARAASSLTVLQAVGERIWKPDVADGRLGGGDVVVDALPRGAPAVEVEQQVRGARIAVARLAHGARIEDPLALAHIGARAVRAGGAGDALAPAHEGQGDVRVADQADAVALGVEAQLGLQGAQDVLPDGVAGAGVEEPDLLLEVLGRQRAQRLEVALADRLARPARRGGRTWGELLERERAGDGQVVVAGEQHVAAAERELDAQIRLRAVADEVAEAPDLVDPGGVDGVEDRLEGLAVAVDVRDHRDVHECAAWWRTRGLADGPGSPWPLRWGAPRPPRGCCARATGSSPPPRSASRSTSPPRSCAGRVIYAVPSGFSGSPRGRSSSRSWPRWP